MLEKDSGNFWFWLATLNLRLEGILFLRDTPLCWFPPGIGPKYFAPEIYQVLMTYGDNYRRLSNGAHKKKLNTVSNYHE